MDLGERTDHSSVLGLSHSKAGCRSVSFPRGGRQLEGLDLERCRSAAPLPTVPRPWIPSELLDAAASIPVGITTYACEKKHCR
jgi:hypothetical protein